MADFTSLLEALPFPDEISIPEMVDLLEKATGRWVLYSSSLDDVTFLLLDSTKELVSILAVRFHVSFERFDNEYNMSTESNYPECDEYVRELSGDEYKTYIKETLDDELNSSYVLIGRRGYDRLIEVLEKEGPLPSLWIREAEQREEEKRKLELEWQTMKTAERPK